MTRRGLVADITALVFLEGHPEGGMRQLVVKKVPGGLALGSRVLFGKERIKITFRNFRGTAELVGTVYRVGRAYFFKPDDQPDDSLPLREGMEAAFWADES